MSDILEISQCNISQIIGETNRFLFHVMLVHVASCIVEGKKSFFGEELFRTLLITAIAIAMYHIFFRKIIEPKIEKMKLICYDRNERISKKKKLLKRYSSNKYYNDSEETESESESGSGSESGSESGSDESEEKQDSEEESESESESSKSEDEQDSESDSGSNKSGSGPKTNQTRKRRNSFRFNTPRNYSERQQILHNKAIRR